MKSHLFLLGGLVTILALAVPAPREAAAASAPSAIFAIAGDGVGCSTPPACGDGGPGTRAALSFPEGMAVDARGYTYMADWGASEIRRVAPDGSISTIAGRGAPCWSAPSCGDGGAAVDASLAFPDGVAVAPDGSVYVADTGDNEIRKVSPAGQITRFAGTGSECSQPPACGDGGPATSAALRAPTAVAVSPSGAVYIVDTGDSEVRKVSSAGTITRVAGSGTQARRHRRVATAASRRALSWTARTASRSDPGGAVYVADGGDNEIRRVSAAGKIASVAGTGAPRSASTSCGDGAPATTAPLNYPDALAVDSSGDLYIADTYDAELRWIPAAGSASLATPSGGVAFSAFAANVIETAVTVRYALSGSASVTLSVGSRVVAHAGGRSGFGVLAWNRRLGSAPAPKGRYRLTLTATAAGHTASQTLNVRLS